MDRLERGTYYGGHDAAAVINAHPYKARGDVYATMVHRQIRDLSNNPVIRRGTICEPGLIDWLEKERRTSLKRDIHVIDREEIFAGTLDALELKTGIIHDVTVTTTRSNAWSSGVANYKCLQLQWYMGLVENAARCVTRNGLCIDEWSWPIADHAVLTVLYADTGTIDMIPVWKDDDLISNMRKECIDFHREHVQKKIPPHEMSENAVKIVYPKDNGEAMTEPDENFIDAAIQYSQARDMTNDWTETKKKCATVLRGYLKEKTKAQWDGDKPGSVSWKTSKGKTVIDHEAMARDLADKMNLGYSELCERYKVEKPGARVLRVTLKKNKTEEKK